MEIIISGYGKQSEKTIARYLLDETFDKRFDELQRIQGQLQPNWSYSLENPSFVCEGDGYLFTITEADDHAVIYLFEKTASGYQLQDQKMLEGGALCHITYSSKNKAIYGACYATGTLFMVQVEAGRFGELLYQEIQGDKDKNPLTRAHCVLLNQDETQLVVINIALDLIYFYEASKSSLKLLYQLEAPKTSGPRHALFSPKEELLYVITEYSNEILVYEHKEGGKLVQRISTLAPNYEGSSNCSTLCFGKNGSYLYAANRGADTIAQFSVMEAGRLEWIREVPCGGKHPRHMIITQDGRYLIVCNQQSDTVAFFQWKEASGAMMDTNIRLPFATPSGVLQVNE